PSFVCSATNGVIDRLTLRDVELQGGAVGLALQTGANVNIRNSQIERLTVKNHGTGIDARPGGWPASNYANVRVLGAKFENVSRPMTSPLPAGITVTP
ncbi:MAG TPA: hypothetical protein VGP44_11725, partial [Gemmatimonadales bacterium]|nr:hypothetical protein [Gemmatimonadales bacterium]